MQYPNEPPFFLTYNTDNHLPGTLYDWPSRSPAKPDRFESIWTLYFVPMRSRVLNSVYLYSIGSARDGASHIEDLIFSLLLIDHESRALTSYLQNDTYTDGPQGEDRRATIQKTTGRQQIIIGNVYVTMYVLVNIWFVCFFGW